MNHYEGMFILKPDLNKDNLEKLLGQIREVIEKNKGSVEEMKEWGRQRLAYPLVKYKEGVYYLINFHIASDAIASIRRSFALNEPILRSLIVRR